MPDTKHWFPRIAVVLIAWLIVVGILHFLTLEEQETQPTEPPKIDVEISKEDIEQANEEQMQYENLLKQGSKFVVNLKPISTPVFTPDDKEANNRIAKEFLITHSIKFESRGSIEEAYLYVRASAGPDSSLLSRKESVYIYLDTGMNGGHLFKPKSLITEQSSSGESQFLFRLDEVSFTSLPYSDENKPESPKNWLKILQTQGTHYIGGFVSSNRRSEIQEIAIVYKGTLDALVKK